MSNDALLLIVRQRPSPHSQLESLVGGLQAAFGLDPYTARQRLLGPGLAVVSQGDRADLDGIAGLLRRHGYPCWVVAPPRPASAPPRLRSLIIAEDHVEFTCEGEQRVRLERGVAAVGVLADISGELAGRQVKRMLAQNAYLGREQARGFIPDEIRKAVLQGQPVFDGYLLDQQGGVTAAFRVFPGRFNPDGLGGRAHLSATRNLVAVADLVGEYAGSFRLYTDFGLSQLPGCLPQPAKDDANALLGNLDALTRYGWLVSGLGEHGDRPSPEEASPGKLLAAGVAGMAALAGSAVAGADLEGLAALVDDADSGQAVPVPPPAPAPLPPPPERPATGFSLGRHLPFVAIVAAGILLAVTGGGEPLRQVLKLFVRSGALPAVAAGLLCWGAFVCLRLKRQIEDTPTSRIRSLAMGLVEVHGRAIRRHALVAPMTQSACVWYRLRKYRRDSNDRWTLTSESDSAHVPFLLDDGSGRVVVEPAGARVRARTEQTGYPGESTQIGAAVDGGPDEKWVEELIYEGTTLYALAYARPARAMGQGLRERTIDLLRRLKLDPQALHRYDTNGDGRLDSDEWQAARDDAEQLAAAEQLQGDRAAATGHVVLGKPPRGLPFLLAESQSDVELSRKYGWGGMALLVLGLAAAGVAAAMFLRFYRLS